MEGSPSPSPTIVRSTPASAAVPLESQLTAAVPEERLAHAAREELPASAGPVLEPQTDAATLTRMAAGPSRPEREASSADDPAILTPKPGSPGDFRLTAAAPDRWEQGWR
jgi:hypothetical protein